MMSDNDWIEYTDRVKPENLNIAEKVEVCYSFNDEGGTYSVGAVKWGSVVRYRLVGGPIVAPKHYDNHYTRPLTDEERATGIVKIKLDPYRVCDALNIGGGAREQIVKKGLRWTSKGHSERQVIKEIMQACERRLEMLTEDGL